MYAGQSITIKSVMTDNGLAYRSHAFANALQIAGIKNRRTKAHRPLTPQTNGKDERYQRTLRDEWGFARAYASESSGRTTLPRWLHLYSDQSPHTALDGKPPLSRATNVTGQNF